MADYEALGRRLHRFFGVAAERKVAGVKNRSPAVSRPGLKVKIGLRATLILVTVMPALCASTAMAEEPNEPQRSSGAIYVIDTTALQSLWPIDASPSLEPQPIATSDSSPTGVFLPDASTYFNLDSRDGELTYLTPRINGVQFKWTEDRTAPAGRPGLDHASGSNGYGAPPKSIGANFSQKVDEFDLSLAADYGRTPKTVPDAVRLVNDQKLLRVGLDGRIRDFTFGGTFGSEVDPRNNLGEPLSWDVFGRYDFGAMEIGLVYNYTIESDNPAPTGIGIPGTLQAGANYYFTPRIAVSGNLAYGNYVDEGGSEGSDVAAVLGFSFAF